MGTERTARKKRVRWTPEEESLVIEEAVIVNLEDEDHIKDYMNGGQRVLPENRRRLIACRNNIKKEMIERFCQMRSEFLDRGEPVQVVVETTDEPTPEVPPAPVEVPVVPVLTREEVLKSITIEEWLKIGAERLAPFLSLIPAILTQFRMPPVQVNGQVAEEKKSVETPTVTTLPVPKTPPPAPTVRPPKVLLCEFLPSQETEIRERAKHFNLELAFQPKTHKPRGGITPHCRWCICMDKRSHARSGQLKKEFRQDHIVLVGGIDAAVKALADIHAKESRIPIQ
jgi:hypothetical protein